jgi:hypothetical protein
MTGLQVGISERRSDSGASKSLVDRYVKRVFGTEP